MPGQVQIRNILIVEDEPTIADTLALILGARGYEARVAYSAERAIEIIADWEPHFAVVDVMLPQMNGIDFSMVLKENYPDCRVLLSSGAPTTSLLLEQALKKGHTFEVFAKPLHPTFILDALERAGNQQPGIDALPLEAREAPLDN